jgi:hypothetical protein
LKLARRGGGTRTLHKRSTHNHQVSKFFQEPLKSEVARWRAEWNRLDNRSRNDSLLQHLSSCMVDRLDGRRPTFELTFLGRRLCHRGFKVITHINPFRFTKLVRRGCVSWERKLRDCPRVKYDEMHAAVHRTLVLLKDSSPFARSTVEEPGDRGDTEDDTETIQVPFHEKIYLFRMILLDYNDAVENRARTPMFSTRPTYSTFRHMSTAPGPIRRYIFAAKRRVGGQALVRCSFRRVLRDPDFARYKFHRVVDIGRCSKCCFLRYKCMSSTTGTTERAEWQRLAAAHQTLQLRQKQVA